jgi:LEA14-like dessication related protein
MRPWRIIFAIFSLLLASCASIVPIKKPEISLVNIEPTKSKGFSQYFTLNLFVTNPNSFDLNIEGVTFNLSVADQKILAGSSTSIPQLKAYKETPVKLTAGIGLFDLLKLLTYFSEHRQEKMKYNFATTIDPSGFIPITINREGILSDDLLSGLKQGKKLLR